MSVHVEESKQQKAYQNISFPSDRTHRQNYFCNLDTFKAFTFILRSFFLGHVYDTMKA